MEDSESRRNLLSYKDKPYQIITFRIHKETCESMVYLSGIV